MTSTRRTAAWGPTLGAVPLTDGRTRFRVWAPRPREVSLLLQTGGAPRVVPMVADADGYREATVDAAPEARYGYMLDGQGPYPDPCARRQPDGVHGLSAVVDATFAWSDRRWRPPAAADLVIYECHIGTFTLEGTFDAAAAHLASLRDLGVNAVELMPVASAAGNHGWGYDGVSLFAPAEAYGGPDGLRRFVNAAHNVGLAVLLDVVCNHFGPDGNYTGLYSDHYTTDRYHTPWGAAINFDGVGSQEVRRFYIEHLQHWVHEYHIDGFRLDATHSIFDAGPAHILAEFAEAVETHSRLRSRPYMIAESHENDVRYVTPREQGGFGFDAVWADDFHHCVRTALTHEHDGYFRGYDGSMSSMARLIRNGFLYEGQLDPALGVPRGTRARRAPWGTFLHCIQNHDQVGNRAFGQRLHHTSAIADVRAATLLLLLLPQIPLLFQGQEFVASAPFLFFSDHNPDLGELVTIGRRREFSAFRAFSDPEVRAAIPDPQAPFSFERSRLDHREAEDGAGRLMRALHRELLRLRHRDPVLRAYRRARLPLVTRSHGRTLSVAMKLDGERRELVVNFGEPANAPLRGSGYRVLLSTEQGRFGGGAIEPRLVSGGIEMPAHCAVLLASGPQSA